MQRTISDSHYSGIGLRPRYIAEESGSDDIRNRLMLIACPFCKLVGTLIHHGFLRGYRNSEYSTRGKRFLCNHRRARNKGCGRTFSCLWTSVIAHRSIHTLSLWMFLSNIANGARSRLSAFKAVLPTNSGKTIHRLWKRFAMQQPIIRTDLLRLLKPPETKSENPIIQTITHLAAAFPSADPVADFQHHFQRSFL